MITDHESENSESHNNYISTLEMVKSYKVSKQKQILLDRELAEYKIEIEHKFKSSSDKLISKNYKFPRTITSDENISVKLEHERLKYLRNPSMLTKITHRQERKQTLHKE